MRGSLSLGYPNSGKKVENTTGRGVYLSKFDFFGKSMRHRLEYLIYLLGSITSRCLGKEPAILPRTRGGTTRESGGNRAYISSQSKQNLRSKRKRKLVKIYVITTGYENLLGCDFLCFNYLTSINEQIFRNKIGTFCRDL